MSKINCKNNVCLLDFLYPKNSEASLACDMECYFENEGAEFLEDYIKRFPERYNEYLKALSESETISDN